MDFLDPLSGIGFPRDFLSDIWVKDWSVVGVCSTFFSRGSPAGSGFFSDIDGMELIMEPNRTMLGKS